MSVLQGASNVIILGGTFNAIQNIHGSLSPSSNALERLSSAAAPSALYDSETRFDPPKCHPNTREPILDRLERWMRELSDQELSLFWLYGGAGAGKSAIMQSIVERCVPHGVVLGTFFFHHADESRNNAEALFRTLAYQVAVAFPSALDILGPVITNNPLVFEASLETQALELVVRPLQHLTAIGQLRAEHAFPHVFAVDGLDECLNPEKQAAVIKIIAGILHDHHLCVKFIIASRPEVAITQAFLNDPRLGGSFDSILLDDDEEASFDIRKYIEDTFVDIISCHPQRQHIALPWPAPHDIDELVWKSSGHFIFASTAMKYIASSKEHPPRALQVILGLERARQGQPFAQLDTLYTHIIKSAAYPSEVLSILRYCSAVSRIVTLDQVYAILEYVPQDTRLFLLDMKALVSIKGHATKILLRHASLRDFFLDESRSGKFYISYDYRFECATRLLLLVQSRKAWHSIAIATDIVNNLVEHLSSVLQSPPHCKAICEHLWMLSPRHFYTFIESGRGLALESEWGRNVLPSKLMDLVLQFGDTSLYAHYFKIYLELFRDLVQQDSRGARQWLSLLPVAPLIRQTSLELLGSLCHEYYATGVMASEYLNHIYSNHDSKALSDLVGQTLEHTVCSNRESWKSDVAEAAICILRRCMQTAAMPSQTVFRESAHRRFLMKRKPQKHLSSGRPILSQWIYMLIRSKWLPGNTWLKYHSRDHFRLQGWKNDSILAKAQKNMFYSSSGSTAMLMDNLVDCRKFLQAIIIIIPRAPYSKRLLKDARAAIPRIAFIWFPVDARRARKVLEAYVEQCLREEATSLRARIEAGSVDALFEHAAGMKMNGLD